MAEESLATEQKAFAVNMDLAKYGAFAEIGAGQEVARWFFRAGGAAGTVAKTISAYDMDVSNSFYGKTDRYVSRQRLETMLDYEYGRLQEELDAKRGEKTTFFVFADTVAATSFIRRNEAHGWLGMKFQRRPRTQPSQIIIHLRLLDKENLVQQEALGIVGVNLLYGAFFHFGTQFITSLLDGVTAQRVEVDLIEFSGPAFRMLDNRLMALKLVRYGLTSAAMFTANGEVVQAAEVLYKKAILVERGSFRPVTRVTLDMLNVARARFVQEPLVQGEPILELMEMTLKNLSDEGVIDYADFLDRVDILGSLGKTVLISNYGEHHRLATYLFRHTKKMIGLVMGVGTLREIFDEKYYTDLEGGILESFGRLFKNALKLYVYPLQETAKGPLITAETLDVAPNLQPLHEYLFKNNGIEGLQNVDKTCLPIFSRKVLAKMRRGDASWEMMVPPQVSRLIKERKLLGWHS
jgi:hypothetical protein